MLEMQALLLDMMSPDPCSRPSAQVGFYINDVSHRAILILLLSQDLCKHPLLNSDAYPCLLQDAICTSDVNILPSLSDPALLEVLHRQSTIVRCGESPN